MEANEFALLDDGAGYFLLRCSMKLNGEVLVRTVAYIDGLIE